MHLINEINGAIFGSESNNQDKAYHVQRLTTLYLRILKGGKDGRKQ